MVCVGLEVEDFRTKNGFGVQTNVLENGFQETANWIRELSLRYATKTHDML